MISTVVIFTILLAYYVFWIEIYFKQQEIANVEVLNNLYIHNPDNQDLSDYQLKKDKLNGGTSLDISSNDPHLSELTLKSKEIYYPNVLERYASQSKNFISKLSLAHQMRYRPTGSIPVLLEYNKNNQTIEGSLDIGYLNIDNKSVAKIPLIQTSVLPETLIQLDAIKPLATEAINGQTILLNSTDKHRLTIYSQTRRNLLPNVDASFEGEKWHSKAHDCSDHDAGQPVISLEASNDVTEGTTAAILQSKNHTACMSKTFGIKLNPRNMYALIFDAKNITGNDIKFFYRLRGKDNQNKTGYSFSQTIMAKNQSWNTYTTVIDSQVVQKNFINPDSESTLQPNIRGNSALIDNIEYIDIYFYAPSDGTKEIATIFDNIRLSEYVIAETKEITLSTFIDRDILIQNNLNTATGITISQLLSNTNLLEGNDASFELGTWKPEAQDCSNKLPGEPAFALEHSDIATQGVKSVQISSQNHFACISKSFPLTLNPNRTYKFSFDYKNELGGQIMYYYNIHNNENKYTKFEEFVVNDSSWHTFETIIDPDIIDATAIDLYFYAPSRAGKTVINSYDNVQLKEWAPKDLGSYYIYTNNEPIISTNTPAITSSALNKWKYEALITEASGTLLVSFNNLFSTKWKLTVKNIKGQSLVENQHYQINDYGNAWWIDFTSVCTNNQCAKNVGTQSYSITIENRNLKLLYLILMITGIVAVLSSVLFYYYHLRHRRWLSKLKIATLWPFD